MIAFSETLACDVATGPMPVEAAAPRFTIDGDDQLERHLAHTCARVVSGIRGLIPAVKLEAIMLGGGYGRGEGGVLRDAGGDRPYNDLEFYVLISGNRHWNEFIYERRLHVLGEILTQLAGVEVEFKITSLAELTSRPISMFSHDLVVGHRMLWDARPEWRSDEWVHHRLAEKIPLEEATRLLMNRCTGLLLAQQKLAQETLTESTTDFVRRNIAKAQLAIGDAVLTSLGLYHASCRERHQRLQKIGRLEPSPWFEQLLRHHAAGVEFKLHPTLETESHVTLIKRLLEVTAFARGCWLSLESRRLGRAFESVHAYVVGSVDLYPGPSSLRHVLLNLRLDRGRFRLRIKPWRHPRQRVFRALALLLWEPNALSDPAVRRRLEGDLNAPIANPRDGTSAYEKLWMRVR